jgi:tryptophan halogenase
LWDKNCIAIGLAGGFIEPLESTAIHLVQSGIAKLMTLFPDRGFSSLEIAAYNDYMVREYAQIRDFIILHYKLTNRTDAPFWQHCRAMDVPDSLRQKIALFSHKGRAYPALDDLFTEHSWVAVMLGQGMAPSGYDPLVDSLSLEELRGFVHHARDMVWKTAQAMPTHQDFIDKQCASRARR